MSSPSANQHKRIWIALILILIALAFASLLSGSADISFSDFKNFIIGNPKLSQSAKLILQEFRIPKLLTAVLAGAGLSVAGLQMQSIFRNPLAGPYILGISSGAGLGVALAVLGTGLFGISVNLYGTWTYVIAAWIGAALIMLLVFAVSIRVNDVMTVLILGILFSGAVAALINILQYFGAAENLKSFVVWSMGSVSGLSFEHLYVMGFTVILGFIPAIFSLKIMDILLLGEHYAQSSGQSLVRARLIIFLSTSLLAGTITAFCGPIGFIGIVVPHLARMLFRTSRHAILLPASAIIGANILIAADILSRLPGVDTVLPLNSVTALIGIPIVVYILLKNRI